MSQPGETLDMLIKDLTDVIAMKCPMMKLSGYFQGQANLNTGKVAGYYYDTQAKIAFEIPLSNQVSDDKKTSLNQGISDYAQVPHFNNQDHTHRDNQSASTPKMTKSHPTYPKYHT